MNSYAVVSERKTEIVRIHNKRTKIYFANNYYEEDNKIGIFFSQKEKDNKIRKSNILTN